MYYWQCGFCVFQGGGCFMLCISIGALSPDAVFRDIRKYITLPGLIELRMDLIREISLPDLVSFIRDLDHAKEILVTVRRDNEDRQDASFRYDDEERWSVLREAVRLNVAYVDVEYGDRKKDIDDLKTDIREVASLTQIICSYHDFIKTPHLQELKRLWLACHKKGGKVVKIVTFARTMTDNLTILSFLSWIQKKKKAKVIAFCMGEKGRISRVAAPLFGSLYTFTAPDETSATAPGQIGAGDMEIFMKVLYRQELPHDLE